MNHQRHKMGLLTAMALTLAACSTCGLDSKLGLIKPGMKANQVENILGRPARIDATQTDDQTVTGQVYHYSTPSGECRVVLVNGVVFKAEFLAEIKS